MRVGDDDLIREYTDRIKWVRRKCNLLDFDGIMLRDRPAVRDGVWKNYGALGGDAVVRHLSPQQVIWNRAFVEMEEDVVRLVL